MQNLDIKKMLLLSIAMAIGLIMFFFMSCMGCFYGYELGVKYLESGEVGMIIGFFTPTLLYLWAYMLYFSPQE